MLPSHSPRIYGHRGAPRVHRENTLEAFLEAHRQGAYGIELDVRLSRDGVCVLHHDPLINGQPIASLTSGELKEFGVVGLEEVVKVLPSSLAIDVEIKFDPADIGYIATSPIVTKTLSVLKPFQSTREWCITSFNPIVLGQVVIKDPSWTLGLLTDGLSVTASARLASWMRIPIIAVRHDAAGVDDPTTIETVHDQGQQILVWTEDDPAQARRLADAGVDIICTNEPGLIRQHLAQP